VERVRRYEGVLISLRAKQNRQAYLESLKSPEKHGVFFKWALCGYMEADFKADYAAVVVGKLQSSSFVDF